MLNMFKSEAQKNGDQLAKAYKNITSEDVAIIAKASGEAFKQLHYHCNNYDQIMFSLEHMICTYYVNMAKQGFPIPTIEQNILELATRGKMAGSYYFKNDKGISYIPPDKVKTEAEAAKNLTKD